MSANRLLDTLPLRIGKHDDPNVGVCIQEIAHLAMEARLVDGRWVLPEGVSLTDLPDCTHPAIAKVAQRLWDMDEDQDRMLRLLGRFLPRLMRAKGTDDRRVNVRLALAAAEFVKRDDEDPRVTECRRVIQAWLDGEASDGDVREARTAAATTATYAAYAAYATATYAAYAADDAAYTAAAYTAAAYAAAAYTAAAADLEALLDHLLTVLDKAKADEGLALWDPEPWEEQAIEFVDRLMAEISVATAEGTQ